jgi:recombination protein RecT
MGDGFMDTSNSDIKSAIANKNASENEAQLTVGKILSKRILTIMPDKKERDNFVNQLTVIREKNVALQKCTPASILECMIASAHLHMLPNRHDQWVYIIPYGTTAQFQLGYKGLIELAYRSGIVKTINAEPVFAEDKFKVSLGVKRTMTHEPSYSIDRNDDKRVIAVYATATMADGSTEFHVMTMSEINKIRNSSQAAKGKSSPWSEWPLAMYKKTVIKQMLKYLPSSTVDNRYKDAIEYDDLAEAGKLKFNEDNTLDIDAETQLAEAPEKPKDKGIKSYSHKPKEEAPEAEVVDNPEQKPKAKKVETESVKEVEERDISYTDDMTDEEIVDAIDEMMRVMALDKVQKTKLYEIAGTSDLSLADRVDLLKVFTKVDEMTEDHAEKLAHAK